MSNLLPGECKIYVKSKQYFLAVHGAMDAGRRGHCPMQDSREVASVEPDALIGPPYRFSGRAIRVPAGAALPTPGIKIPKGGATKGSGTQKRETRFSSCLSFLVRPSGFGPLAFRLGGGRSIQLSYGRIGRGPAPAGQNIIPPKSYSNRRAVRRAAE